MITKKLFDVYEGENVYVYELSNGKLKVGITDFGGAIQYLKVTAPDGEKDVCLGFGNVKDYIESNTYCGATIGRVANRIAGASYTLNGEKIVLSENDNGNTLHGGACGFDKKLFTAEIEGEELLLSLVSPDGDSGFKGNLELRVSFSLDGNVLKIQYTARSDKDTLWCPTCHAYFNLNGEGIVYGNKLKINATEYTPIDGKLIPSGEILPVLNTPFDFTQFKPIGKDIYAENVQLKLGGGYDHNFCLNGNFAASAYGADSGIKMNVYTDMPGLQFYSGNMIKGNGKNGELKPRSGFCLEPQFFPNAVNVPRFETPLLKANETKRHYIHYEFC